MWITLLEFGTLWFWLATITPLLLLILFVNNERSGEALSTIVITAIAFGVFGDKHIVPWVFSHPVEIFEYACAYIVIGIVWGFVKWYFYNLDKRDEYIAIKQHYIHHHGEMTNWTEKQKNEFQYALKASNLPPQVIKNKGKIIFWMTYWIPSAIWTLLNDPLSRLGKFLYNHIGGIFQKISDSMFSKYSDDFK